ncbi:MAG: hypothetical protein ACRCS6_11550 [Turicibacter sp.]
MKAINADLITKVICSPATKSNFVIRKKKKGSIFNPVTVETLTYDCLGFGEVTAERLNDYNLFKKDGELWEKPRVKVYLTKGCSSTKHFDTEEEAKVFYEMILKSNPRLINF